MYYDGEWSIQISYHPNESCRISLTVGKWSRWEKTKNNSYSRNHTTEHYLSPYSTGIWPPNANEMDTTNIKYTWPTRDPTPGYQTQPIFHWLALGVCVGGNANFMSENSRVGGLDQRKALTRKFCVAVEYRLKWYPICPMYLGSILAQSQKCVSCYICNSTMELKEGNHNYRDWGDSHKATCPESLNGPYLPIHHRVRGAARSVSFTAPRGFIPTLRSSC